MEKEYFAHNTAIVDEGCKIGARTKIGIFVTLCREVSLARIAILVKM